MGGLFPPREEGRLRHQENIAKHQSGADGVVAHEPTFKTHPETLRVSDHPVRSLGGGFAAFVAVGMEIALHPPHRSGRTGFPYPALAAGQPHKRADEYFVVRLDGPAPAHWANRAGSMSRDCRALARSPLPNHLPSTASAAWLPLCSAAS